KIRSKLEEPRRGVRGPASAAEADASTVGRLQDLGLLSDDSEWFSPSIEQSPLPSTLLALDLTFVKVNEAWARLLGRRKEDFAGLQVQACLHPENGSSGHTELTSLANGSATEVTYERVLKSVDGSAVPVLIMAWMVTDSAGSNQRIAAVIYDLRDLKRAEQAALRRERMAAAVGERAAGTAIVLSAEGDVRYVSATAERLFDGRPPELGQRCDWLFLHPDDRARAAATFGAGLSDPFRVAVETVRTANEDEPRWLEQIVSNYLADPDIGGLVINFHEVTKRVRAEEARRVSEERYRLIAETTLEGIWASSADGTTLYANRRLAEIIGVPLETIYDGSVRELFPVEFVTELMRRFRKRHDRGREQYEVAFPRPDGEERVVTISATPLIDESAKWLGSLAMFSDVTAARAAEAELRRRSLYDQLTELPNRGLVQDRMTEALKKRRRSSRYKVELLAIGMDNFKRVNSYLSHRVGDDVLRELACRIKGCLDPEDTLARIAGDEFAVLRQGQHEESIEQVAEAVHRALQEPVVVNGTSLAFTASIGVAAAPAADAATLLSNANAAMQEAKARGHGRTAVFERGRVRLARRRLELSNDLRKAIEDGELDLHYQPIIALCTDRLIGMEALARWRHPAKGWIAPDEFVGIAEEMGLAPALDRYVIDRACRDAATMIEQALLPADGYVAVNVSAANLSTVRLDDAIIEATCCYGITPSLLRVEITETALMDDAEDAIKLLTRLHDMGTTIAIDDFGTGYSSLAYLQRLPVDGLKIDRSFVTKLGANESADSAIVASIVGLAEAVKITTVAEGIETAEQRACLEGLGVQAGQGWLWSKAMPLHELAGYSPAGTQRPV
ncbi:MAG: hypothetical protein QOK10_1076, partial [Pseudonocardiales bacterium]|nr:hypothetical protein [Pseudonocardiales bacterium]